METEGSGRARDAHPGEDRLLDLILDTLPPAEEAACLAHLRQCVDCEERARVLAASHERFRAKVHITLKSEASAPESVEGREMAGSFSPGSSKRPARRTWWPRLAPVWAISAAVAVVGIVLIVRYDGREAPDRLEAPWLVDPRSMIVTTRDGTVPAIDPKLLSGFEAYARHDLDGAIRSLEQGRCEQEMESLRGAYLGSALVRKGEFRRAIGVLRPLHVEELPGTLGDESRWTLYVALSGADEIPSADSLLTLLGREAGRVGDRARQRLGRP